MTSKLEYLKRYMDQTTDKVEPTDLDAPKKKLKLRKKKKPVAKASNVKIFDGNVDLKDVKAGTDSEASEDGGAFIEEAPQIAGIVDDRPPEMRSFSSANFKQTFADRPADPSSLLTRRRRDSGSSIEDRSRLHRKDPSLGHSPKGNAIGRKGPGGDHTHRREPSDGDPPRKQRQRYDSDESPPRKRQIDADVSPSRKRRDSDASPPRKRRDSDASPPRKRQDADLSPPRKRRGDSDSSPPRKRTDADVSTSRKRREFDASPPRKYRGSGENSARDTSPSRKRVVDTSPPRRDRLKGGDTRREITQAEILDGPEVIKLRGGRKEAAAAAKAEKEEKEARRKQIYEQWNSGVVQREQRQRLVEETLYESAKPLARGVDDADLEKHLKQADREGDPMLALLRKKKHTNASEAGGSTRPRYNGPAGPPNRFGILPGYRWDGVDRSNGFEAKMVTIKNEKAAVEEQAYKWSTEDM